jgi:hypothetical protein
MRYNDSKNDSFSKCAVYNQTCSPPYCADLAKKLKGIFGPIVYRPKKGSGLNCAMRIIIFTEILLRFK